MEYERLLFKELVGEGAPLSARDIETLRYAFSLARVGQIEADSGTVDLFELIAPYRHWLLEQLEYYLSVGSERPLLKNVGGGSSTIDWRGISQLLPQLARRIEITRRHVLESEVGRFSEEQFEEELTHRKLVLVLGGGGGSGYPHLGLFAVLNELGLVPSLIVGSSMGALLGLFRACSIEYEPMLISMGLPRPRDFRKVFSPYRGYTRFGFPGVFELKMRPLASEIFRTMLGRSIPRLNELPIPFRAIGTGLMTGMDVKLSEVEAQISDTERAFTPLRFHRRFRLFRATLNMMLQNPRSLREVAFGSPGLLEDFDAVDAVGFSCAVPGFIHYDIFRKDSASSPTLQQYFKENSIFRLTDGGVANNVPNRIAWEAVEDGEIGSRNVFILSLDAFSPQFNANLLFYPIQKLIGSNVEAQRPYSHYQVSYHNPPSPVKLLQGLDAIERIVAATRTQLDIDRGYLSLMLRAIPRWQDLHDTA